MVLPGRELLCGVEVDECYIGARRQGSGGRGAVGKAIVVIAAEERGQGPGRVRMQRVPNVTKDTLTDFVLDHVARHSEVRTDRLAATSTLASTASSTSSRTSQRAAIPLMWCCRTCTSLPRWSSAGSSGRTRGPSVTTSSTTTWTSSRSASTVVTHATVACCSNDSCRALWPLIPIPIAPLLEKPPHSQLQSRIGVAKWIASSAQSNRAWGAAVAAENHADGGRRRLPRTRRIELQRQVAPAAWQERSSGHGARDDCC